MAKITGLGGIFHVVKDPKATRAWYKEYLGLEGEYGPMLKWSEETDDKPYSLISHFTDDEYIKPGKGGFMINLRVDNVEEFVEELKAKGVEVLGFADEGYGKFAWILDCDGVKIELWQQCAAPE
ncbi:VOC family protein [Sphingorhabdus sp. Alg239-R122]|uniref:VOC family protein n=1 Tax=Sphingorhabdus sp. Alg239-R122 TaxID=2305989 RepID=UPI0013D9D20D|nr:VOC family protein [Sphingorhabdus sp. Alg239-R122]